MADETLLGIDIGTTAVKAILFSASGSVLAQFSTAYETARSKNGFVEQDPETWIQLVKDILSRFNSEQDLSGLKAIGITSQVNTHVFVDKDGKALAPAIVWQDGRCDDEARELDERIPAERRIKWWGAPRPIDASHALARMLWMSRHHPEVWQKTRWVMLPKDYCLQRLTGAAVTDPISNLGLVNMYLDYIPELLDCVPGAADRVVPLADMSDIAETVKDELDCAGVPVAVGTMDAWAGMFGTGIPGKGTAMYLSGTSEILGIVSPKAVPTPGVLTFPKYRDTTVHAGPTQSGGASFLWCSQLLGRDPYDLAKLVEGMDFDKPAPLFLPHLQGERAPIWDIRSRGTLLGIDAATGPAEFTRAVFEGVACSAAWLLERLEQSADTQPEIINCGGGGFRSDIWNQIRADILGRRLQRTAVRDPGILGAAGIAAVAAGQQPDLATAFSNLVQFDKVYEPNQARQPRYIELVKLYKRSYEAACETNHALVSLFE
ncbi:FGGY-family carbohydrate kinase [Hoeflea sp. TYP-13]|uniref:FGGY-family carbohydrate kinase n=1 Tax=Hoeflea sp. TYP-13 TaxID=3230023 RepID=UPI0034C6DE32